MVAVFATTNSHEIKGTSFAFDKAKLSLDVAKNLFLQYMQFNDWKDYVGSASIWDDFKRFKMVEELAFPVDQRNKIEFV